MFHRELENTLSKVEVWSSPHAHSRTDAHTHIHTYTHKDTVTLTMFASFVYCVIEIEVLFLCGQCCLIEFPLFETQDVALKINDSFRKREQRQLVVLIDKRLRGQDKVAHTV